VLRPSIIAVDAAQQVLGVDCATYVIGWSTDIMGLRFSALLVPGDDAMAALTER
jgi:hypothetical protein